MPHLISKSILVLSALAFNLCGIAHSAPVAFKTTITDLAGKTQHLPAPGHKATAIIFLAHDCPISNAYAPEINHIASDYSKRGVRFLIAYAESDFDAPSARKHSRSYNFQIPTVLDPKFTLSHAVGATVTPEVVVFSSTGARLYRGRIDDRFVSYGKKRTQPTKRDLRSALDAIIAGKPVSQPTTIAIGCFIPEAEK